MVWGDVHHRTAMLQKVLQNHGDTFEKRIFLGDWFDNFHDCPDHAKRTALVLAELMEDPRNIFIEGNHDSSYRYANSEVLCSGFTWDKHRFIHSVLEKRHWDKFKLFEYDQGWLCSHAGVHTSIFEHPINGLTLEGIDKICKDGVDAVRVNIHHAVYDMGIDCGGKNRHGGINWLRWGRFEPIEGWNQIVGHTPVSKPEIIYARKKTSTHAGKTKEWIETVGVEWDHYEEFFPINTFTSCSFSTFSIPKKSRFHVLTISPLLIPVIEDGEVEIQLTLDYL